MSSAEVEEERRIMRQRRRQQVLREFWQMLSDSTWESAAEVARLFGWIIFFIVLLTLITPQQ